MAFNSLAHGGKNVMYRTAEWPDCGRFMGFVGSRGPCCISNTVLPSTDLGKGEQPETAFPRNVS